MQEFISWMLAHFSAHENDQESVAASELLVLPWISCLEGLAGAVLVWRELLANTLSFTLMLSLEAQGTGTLTATAGIGRSQTPASSVLMRATHQILA